ncbi:unnamed protein product [Cyclocybe aegerita]|uniref:Uncharacterized protein n=1 Tax=Cyclocybe aegerita TaxID=1973307 RepID=A0A8S0XZZ3_CYCAE|nr:unnamed protein product [Cyclocybe aegerita]
MPLPPRPLYLAQRGPQLLAGPITAYALTQLAHRFVPAYESTTFQTVVAVLLSGPILFALLLSYDDVKNYFAARVLGARLPPRVLDYSPGNVWSIVKELRAVEAGYLTDGIEENAEYCGGYVFNLRILFQNRMITLEPEHLKAVTVVYEWR